MLVPKSPIDLTPEIIRALIATQHPDVGIDDVQIVEVKDSDSIETSSSARIDIAVKYTDGNPQKLPERLIAKLTQSDPGLWYSNLHAMYANELDFYNRLRPELDLEAPAFLGSAMDADGCYILLMEDVRPKGGVVYTVLTEDVTVAHARAVLDTLARLHARFWRSPRFETDLSWVGSQTDSDLEMLMRDLIAQGITSELKLRKFKREILGILGMTEDQLRKGCIAVKEHQDRLPPTILHGDSHLGNMYFLPDMTAGLLDWQLMCRGYPAHDVGYFITVALPVEIRRVEERALLDFYLAKLKQYGAINPPDRETFWLEYRRALIWGVYIGWLTVPAENYGWEHSFVCHLRVVTAFLDHDTRKLVEALY